MKIGITGSLNWDDKIKIKKIIFDLKQRFKNEKLIIVSRGQKYGVDAFAKKFCMEFSIDYQEFPLNHQSWNQHCVENAYMFNRQYSVTHYFSQNKKLINYCDVVIIFTHPLDKDVLSQQDLLKKIIKSGKKYMIIN
jgi:hypothetical protein